MESDVIKSKIVCLDDKVPSDEQCIANSDKGFKLPEERSLDEGCIFLCYNCVIILF